ncbi:MAG: twin-arginine translocation signal domain-containing protein [Phycisphaerae bacterium]|nr:twin-arginine translocation signal domain-containing protein [Phycisphaerae bacterium]
MSASDQTTRRTFLKTAAATGVALAGFVPGCTTPGRRGGAARLEPRNIFAPARQKLRIAFIGTGGIGKFHLEHTQELGVACPSASATWTRAG